MDQSVVLAGIIEVLGHCVWQPYITGALFRVWVVDCINLKYMFVKHIS